MQVYHRVTQTPRALSPWGPPRRGPGDRAM